jgi:hypothetical protein
VSSSLGVLNPGIDVQVVDAVAGLVVADVVVDVGLTAPPKLKQGNELEFAAEIEKWTHH